MTRDPTIDGFRAIAAVGVVLAHGVAYRLSGFAFPGLHYLQRIADPLAQTSVQIFFVVSGYIITTLLLKEEQKRGRISIPAFYIRRACRIIPPLVVLYASILAFRHFGLIALDDASLISSATFTCNLGIVECKWWVAHTWSLAVEEQFYLFWPMLLLTFPRRTLLLMLAVAATLIAFLVAPLAWHSNYISFSCIGVGALCASSVRVQATLRKSASYIVWLIVGVGLVLGPVFVPAKPMQAAAPFLILYLIFAARELALVRTALAVRPVQMVGLASYSIYLWQQVFLAKPALYLGPVFSVWLLPVIVILSVLLVEQPFIRLGRKLSSAVLSRKRAEAGDEYGTAMPAP